MLQSETFSPDQMLDIEAEILRYLWYEGKATPDDLSSELQYDLPIIDECLGDLLDRACVFPYFTPHEEGEEAIYCITKRVQRKLHKALTGYGRYRLKSFWMSFNREDVVWLTNISHS